MGTSRSNTAAAMVARCGMSMFEEAPMWLRSILAALAIQVGAVVPAWAELGQPAASVERDRAAMGGEVQSRPGERYSIETITVVGMTIKQYVSSKGIVFAIVWNGTGAPNLPLLLGSYFDEYKAEFATLHKAKPRSRKPMLLKTAHLVVERAGHSRYMWGRAFIPSLLPAMTSPEEIQ